MNLFKKRQYVSINANAQKQRAEERDAEHMPVIPDGLWIKCSACGKIIYRKELDGYKICPACDAHFRMCARERIRIVADEGTFAETDEGLVSKNPLAYPGYEKKILSIQEATDLNDAVVCGVCLIGGYRVVLCVMDASFMMGSMGSVVGEKVTRAFELALAERLPVVIFTASGGARMQEGIVSLMQMAKVSAAVNRHGENGLFYVSVLTDPTTGGVTASFAMLGDIILAEPNALIGFAGRRVIEQTMNQALPNEFQKAEFLLEHGFVDAIAHRRDMKETLTALLRIHSPNSDRFDAGTGVAGR